MLARRHTLAKVEERNNRLRANLAGTEVSRVHSTNPPLDLVSPTVVHIVEEKKSMKPFRNAEVVKLVVGGPASPAREDTPVTFHVHQPLLEQSSPFFRVVLSQSVSRALPGDDNENALTWLEGGMRKIYLPEDRVEDIEMLLQWLYSSGRCRNASMSNIVNTCEYHDLYKHFIQYQTGLEYPEIDAAVSKYASWKFTRDLEPKTEVPQGKLRVIDEPATDTNTQAQQDAQQDATDDQTVPPPPSSFTAPSLSKPSTPQSLQNLYRPAPPPFGPLIRLYILADKYDIDGATILHSGQQYKGLRNQIVQRVKAIRRLANCVPDIKDVARLWTCVPVDTEAEWGLKEAIVDMYAGLNHDAFKRVFRVERPQGGQNGVGGVGDREGVTEGQGRADVGEQDWHPEFLKELLVQKVLGEIGVEKEVFGVRKDRCNAESEEDCSREPK